MTKKSLNEKNKKKLYNDTIKQKKEIQMKNIKNKILGLSALALSPLTAATTLTDPGATNGLAQSVWAIFDKGQVYIKLGLLIAAVYGGYKLFIADDKSVLNWFLFGAGAGGIGAYDTIAQLVIDFLKVT